MLTENSENFSLSVDGPALSVEAQPAFLSAASALPGPSLPSAQPTNGAGSASRAAAVAPCWRLGGTEDRPAIKK